VSSPAIPDVITVIGFAYLQPISDLLERLLEKSISKAGPAGVSDHENGYSAATILLLVALLESFTARLRFVRKSEGVSGSLSTPELLPKFFPALDIEDDLVEVCLVRNVLAHNHIWHMDVSDFPAVGAPTLATPKELGFHTNKEYEHVVDVSIRRTRKLSLNVTPTLVDRSDVRKVFKVVWSTLEFMHAADFRHTPLAGRTVRFQGQRRQFEALLDEFESEGGDAL